MQKLSQEVVDHYKGVLKYAFKFEPRNSLKYQEVVSIIEFIRSRPARHQIGVDHPHH